MLNKFITVRNIFAFSASRKNSAVIFVSVWLANAQNLTRHDGLSDGGLEVGTCQPTFLAENPNSTIFHSTLQLTLPKCKHLNQIFRKFNQNISFNVKGNIIKA